MAKKIYENKQLIDYISRNDTPKKIYYTSIYKDKLGDIYQKRNEIINDFFKDKKVVDIRDSNATFYDYVVTENSSGNKQYYYVKPETDKVTIYKKSRKDAKVYEDIGGSISGKSLKLELSRYPIKEVYNK